MPGAAGVLTGRPAPRLHRHRRRRTRPSTPWPAPGSWCLPTAGRRAALTAALDRPVGERGVVRPGHGRGRHRSRLAGSRRLSCSSAIEVATSPIGSASMARVEPISIRLREDAWPGCEHRHEPPGGWRISAGLEDRQPPRCTRWIEGRRGSPPDAAPDDEGSRWQTGSRSAARDRGARSTARPARSTPGWRRRRVPAAGACPYRRDLPRRADRAPWAGIGTMDALHAVPRLATGLVLANIRGSAYLSARTGSRPLTGGWGQVDAADALAVRRRRHRARAGRSAAAGRHGPLLRGYLTQWLIGAHRPLRGGRGGERCGEPGHAWGTPTSGCTTTAGTASATR